MKYRFVSSCLLLGFTAILSAETLTCGDDFSRRIPAEGDGHAWMEPVKLFLDRHIIISDLDVYLYITHSEISDLQIWLDGPQGISVLLKQQWPPPWRVKYPDMHDTIIDDQAADYLTAGTSPYTGRFKPAPGSSLAVFNNSDGFGTWTLRILDGAYMDTGTLQRWELRFSFQKELPPGDLDSNGVVNLADFALLARDWLKEAPTADINGTAPVDIADLQILLQHWLTSID